MKRKPQVIVLKRSRAEKSRDAMAVDSFERIKAIASSAGDTITLYEGLESIKTEIARIEGLLTFDPDKRHH